MNKQLIQSRIIKTEEIAWQSLQFLQGDDFKSWDNIDKEKLRRSIMANGFSQPFYVWQDADGILYCLDGYHRIMILKEMIGEGEAIPELLPGTFIGCTDKQEAARLVLQYSSIYAKVTEAGLLDFLDAFDLNFDDVKFQMNLPDFDALDFEASLRGATQAKQEEAKNSLHEKFIVPPFSVLDTRLGYWQERKKKWQDLGINSQESREDVELIAQSGQPPAIYKLRNEIREMLGRDPEWEEIIAEARKRGLHLYEGASIFDPVLCEVLYHWFCLPASVILDPFAGGSVRGIVAGTMGHIYYGIDLRKEQVNANYRQARKMEMATPPTWYCGNSNGLDQILPATLQADFLFTCPPYHDLEQYSDDPADLSNMPWDTFLENYHHIIYHSCQRVKSDRFACFVVGEIRDRKGIYKNFVAKTIEGFEAAGFSYYNEIILVNVAGSLAIRVGRQFSYRKVGKTHQNVLVFYKGDPKNIKDIFPAIEVPDGEGAAEIRNVEKL